jgi:hypothetical protein
MKSFRLLVLLVILGTAPCLQAQPLPTVPVTPVVPPAAFPAATVPVDLNAEDETTSGRFWVSSGAILFWMRGQTPPPLITTSPAGTAVTKAGVLGDPGTTILFGGGSENTGARLGGHFLAGGWLDENRTLGLEADFLFMEDKTMSASFSSNGSVILARPYTNALTTVPVSNAVAFPGLSSGSVSARVATTGLIGGGLQLRENINLGPANFFRLDVVGGYRCFHFSDSLGVSESLTSTNPANPDRVIVGTEFLLTDKFEVSNTFNGFDLGVCAEFFSGPLTLQIVGKVAAGINQEEVDIFGGTTVRVPGLAPVQEQGGLLALTSNIGHYGRKQGTIIPELNCRLAYQATDSVRFTLGYTLIMWDDAARASSQVDSTINPNFIPGVAVSNGPINPNFFSFHQTGVWIQGVNVGMEFMF